MAVEWNKILLTWRTICNRYSVDPTGIEVEHLDDPNGSYGGHAAWITYRKVRSGLELKDFDLTDYKGPQETIHLLKACEQEEHVAATWIAATLHSMYRTLPEHWRGATFRLISSLQLCILDRFRNEDIDIDPWHTNSRNTLGINLDYDMYPKITKRDNLIEIIALESVINFNSFIPVYFRHQPISPETRKAIEELGAKLTE